MHEPCGTVFHIYLSEWIITVIETNIYINDVLSDIHIIYIYNLHSTIKTVALFTLRQISASNIIITIHYYYLLYYHRKPRFVIFWFNCILGHTGHVITSKCIYLCIFVGQ